MAWSVLNPTGSRTSKLREVDWKKRYRDVLSSFDYKETQRLREQNKALTKKVNELTYLLSVHRKKDNPVPIDVVDELVANLCNIPIKNLYAKKLSGSIRAKHIIRFIAYHGYGMSNKSVGWRYGKTSHSNVVNSKSKVLDWYRVDALTDAEISIIKEYTDSKIFNGL
jgi:chromosomal replication initiation ATPase DnaA